ncbi:hypothetical protein QQ994_01865 [Pseudomonas asiatica]|uniref:ApeA N-terminal domain 1-containing protein n=1 Tax=Pseudomonas asiatica TaxID=2219225 RepID=UPI0025708A8A|nr:HEPN domain-containing protein [Pseudomonas asiatica]WJD70654.1 hypothetical protein QQ994_01865 [Pseudomonas asiatica]
MAEPKKKAVKGKFWLAGCPEYPAPGILNIQDNGDMDLELFGLLKGREGKELDEGRINGKVDEYGLVTLNLCFYQYEALPIDDIQTSRIIVNEAILGAAYGETDDLEFHSLYFEVDNLHIWSHISGLTRNVGQGGAYSVDFKLPQNIDYSLRNGFTLTLGFGFSVKNPSFTAVNLEQSVYWKISSDRLRPLEEFRDCAFKINNFLSLAMDQPVCMRNFKLTNNNLVIRYGDSEVARQLGLIYRVGNYQSDPVKTHIQAMLFGLPHVRDKFESLINIWLNLYDVADPALNLFFSVINEPNTFSESKFLSLAQSMETLHRRTNHDTATPEAEFEEFKRRVLSSAPEDTHEWLESKFKFGNELTFKKRVLDLISPFQKLLGSSQRKKTIAHKIVISRNYYTHYNPDLELHAQKGEDLLNLTYTMEALCKLILIQMLGFTFEEIEKMIGQRIRQALQAEARDQVSEKSN